jgi:hypothetical protein
MTVYSHNTFQGPETNSADTPNDVRTYVHRGSSAITISNGEAVATTRGTESYNASDLAKDTFGDDWRGTARSKNGGPTSSITADSLVTIKGTQGRVRDFVAAGRLHETSPGVFEEAAAVESTPHAPLPQADQHAALMPDAVVESVNAALEPVPDHALPALVGAAAAAMSGSGSIEALVTHVVKEGGVDPAEARSRVEFVMRAYQAQTDSFLTHRMGIAADDLKAFYAEVQQDPRAMQNAINTQMNGRSMSAWAKLAEKHYFAKQPPSDASLKAAGFETRDVSGNREVRINGIWASVKGAARAGLI